MLVPDGPPKWLQFQRQAHKYEDITILDDSSMHAYLTGHKGSFKSGQGNAKSVGNLHMAWDESDIRCVHVHIIIMCVLMYIAYNAVDIHDHYSSMKNVSCPFMCYVHAQLDI